jgi:hypothetical protein
MSIRVMAFSSSNKYSARLRQFVFSNSCRSKERKVPQAFSCPAVQSDFCVPVTDGFDGFFLAYDTMVKFLLEM